MQETNIFNKNYLDIFTLDVEKSYQEATAFLLSAEIRRGNSDNYYVLLQLIDANGVVCTGFLFNDNLLSKNGSSIVSKYVKSMVDIVFVAKQGNGITLTVTHISESSVSQQQFLKGSTNASPALEKSLVIINDSCETLGLSSITPLIMTKDKAKSMLTSLSGESAYILGGQCELLYETLFFLKAPTAATSAKFTALSVIGLSSYIINKCMLSSEFDKISLAPDKAEIMTACVRQFLAINETALDENTKYIYYTELVHLMEVLLYGVPIKTVFVKKAVGKFNLAREEFLINVLCNKSPNGAKITLDGVAYTNTGI